MKKNKLKAIVGMSIMIIALLSLFLWTTYGQPVINTTVVLVANQDIEPGTPLSASLLKEIRVDKDQLVSGAITAQTFNAISGLGVKQFIPKNAMLTARYFAPSGLILSEDEFILKLPEKWVYAVPSSMRRGDTVMLYAVDAAIEEALSSNDKKNENTNAEANAEKPNASGQPSSESAEGGEQTEAPNQVLQSYTPEGEILTEIDSLISAGKLEKVISATAVHVKDNSNREVVDVNNHDRLDGSAQVGSVEIIVSQEQLETLEKWVSGGYRFILVYR